MEKYCPGCGQANPVDAAFCHKCATSLAGQQSGPTQQSPPNQQWNPPAGGPAMGTAPQSSQAVATSNKPMIAVGLVALGLICCFPIASIAGAIMGWMEMNAIKEGRSPQSGMGMAQGALWGGIIVTILTIIGGFVLLFMSMAGGGGYYY